MAATTMHFGPEWMRNKHQSLSRPQQPPSPPPNPPSSGLSSYSALVSTVPGVETDKTDEVHPFRYTKDELLRIYKESPKGGLGLEVERWEGVVREIGAEPVALREMGDGEKKLFSGPLNSDLRRRQSTDYLSPLNTSLGAERPRLSHAPTSATGSPLRDRFKRRDSNADSPTVSAVARKQSLSSLHSPTAASRTIGAPAPRNRPGYSNFDGVLSSGDTWSARRRASEASLKPGSARETGGEAEFKDDAIPEDGTNGRGDAGQSDNVIKESTTSVGGTSGARQQSPATTVPNPPATPQDLAAVDWSYKDPTGSVQGPFRADLMQKWFDDGYFTMDLPMKRIHLDATWMTLEELIKRATVPDKMFMCPLATPGPPGLSRRTESPLLAAVTSNDVFSNPYQPSPVRSLRSSTLDSFTGSSSVESPGAPMGQYGTNSPDSSAFANRLNAGYGNESNIPYSEITPLRQRHIADLAHESPLRMHSPSYNSIIGNQQVGYENYGYSGFTPVQSSPWGTPSQTFAAYNPNPGFVASNYNATSHYGHAHHNQPLGGHINPLVYGNPDLIHLQQQQMQSQGYFDPSPVVNGVLNEQSEPIPTVQTNEQFPVSSLENQLGHATISDNTNYPSQTNVENISSSVPWDAQPDVSNRRIGPFDTNHPTTLNTTVPAASSQSSPWGQPLPGSQLASPAKEVSPWGQPTQNLVESVWPEPAQEATLVSPIEQPSTPVDVDEASIPGGTTPSVESVDEAPLLEAAAAAPPAKTKKTKKAAEVSTGIAPTDVASPSEETTEQVAAAQPTKAPWAKPEKKKGKTSITVSLRDIQDAEAKLAEARKAEKEKERARAAAAVVIHNEDVQPFTASWGLPTSQTGSRAAATKETIPSMPASGSAAPVWTTAAKPPVAKTMKEIQEEEERRKKLLVKETAAVTVAKRGYAEQTVKNASSSAPAPAQGSSAWVTVGAGGKSGSTAPSSRPATAVVTPVPAAVTKPAATPAVRSAASVVRPTAGKVEEFPVSPSHEFLKWLSESLKGLNNSVNVEEIISMLLSFSLDPDPSTVEIISDTIYANSTILDGRRFASEFVAKRKQDAANRAKGVNAAKGPSKPVSIAEVVKATPKAAQAEWGFKVVNKKKKGGRS